MAMSELKLEEVGVRRSRRGAARGGGRNGEGELPQSMGEVQDSRRLRAVQADAVLLSRPKRMRSAAHLTGGKHHGKVQIEAGGVRDRVGRGGRHRRRWRYGRGNDLRRPPTELPWANPGHLHRGPPSAARAAPLARRNRAQRRSSCIAPPVREPARGSTCLRDSRARGGKALRVKRPAGNIIPPLASAHTSLPRPMILRPFAVPAIAACALFLGHLRFRTAGRRAGALSHAVVGAHGARAGGARCAAVDRRELPRAGAGVGAHHADACAEHARAAARRLRGRADARRGPGGLHRLHRQRDGAAEGARAGGRSSSSPRTWTPCTRWTPTSPCAWTAASCARPACSTTPPPWPTCWR